MAGEALLILEPDTAAEQRLNELLAAKGYQVYAADDLASVLRALESTRFPLVLIDTAALQISIEEASNRISTLQPDTMVVFTGAACSMADALAMLRGGAVDFIERPFDGDTIGRRLAAALKRRKQQRARLKLWESRAKAAEMALEQARTGSGAKSDALTRMWDFAEYALETFLVIERKSADLERQLRECRDPGSSARRAPVRAWVAHSDAEFAAGVVSLGPKLRLDFGPAMTTGGEVLDKLSGEPPQMIVLDATLPDIPGEFLVGTIRAEYPGIQMVVIEGWGTDNRRVVVTGSAGPETEHPMTALSDLVTAMEEAAHRAEDATAGRDFAAGFKDRHEEFLRRFADAKKLVDGSL